MDPTKIHPTADNILVKRYRKPEVSPGGIVIPVTAADDTSWTYWEVVRIGPKVSEMVGTRLRPDDILRTRPMAPVDLGMEDPADNRSLYMISAERVNGVIAWK